MVVDHVIILLALLLGDPLRTAAICMLSKKYKPKDAEYIWSIWEPHFQLPPAHPLSEGNLAKDHVLTMLQTAYGFGGHPRGDIHCLHDGNPQGGGNCDTNPPSPPPHHLGDLGHPAFYKRYP